jgi:hypothetical protein
MNDILPQLLDLESKIWLISKRGYLLASGFDRITSSFLKLEKESSPMIVSILILPILIKKIPDIWNKDKTILIHKAYYEMIV